MTDFKDRLIAARERSGLSQTALGEVSDMAGTQISRYEAGRAVPRRAATQRLARALGVSYEWLAAGEGPERQFLVRMEDGGNWPPLTLRADPETQAKFLQLAAQEGISPDDFLVRVVIDHLNKVHVKSSTGLDEQSELDALKKRIESLEMRVVHTFVGGESEDRPPKPAPRSRKSKS